MAVRQRVVIGDVVTYVVLDRRWRVVEPVEEYLECLRQEEYSPHTVRAYAHGLACWWSMLEGRDVDWSGVGRDDLARFKRLLHDRGTDSTVITLRSAETAASSTADVGLTLVLSFYRYRYRAAVTRARGVLALAC